MPNFLTGLEHYVIAAAVLGVVFAIYLVVMAVRHGVPWVMDKFHDFGKAASSDYSALVAEVHTIRTLAATDIASFSTRLTALEEQVKSILPKA